METNPASKLILSRLKNLVSLSFLAGLALTPKLWLSSHSYPLSPIMEWIVPLPAPWDSILYGALLALLVLTLFRERPKITNCLILGLCFFLAIGDQSRWQPWFYQYVFMIAAMTFCHFLANSEKMQLAALDACRVLLWATYFWAGVHKLNYGFIHEVFPWVIGGVIPHFAESPLAAGIAKFCPFAEISISILLLFSRSRKAAIVGAALMHLFLLIALGPWGRNWNSVIWPWNFAMPIFLFILFWEEEKRPVREMFFANNAVQRVALALFVFLPSLREVNSWDAFLSFSLYSGGDQAVTLYFDPVEAQKLPAAVKRNITGEGKLFLLDWAMSELNVPPYPAERITQNLIRKICSDFPGTEKMKFYTEGKMNRITGARDPATVGNCADLKLSLFRSASLSE